jgi:hypothetical protein
MEDILFLICSFLSFSVELSVFSSNESYIYTFFKKPSFGNIFWSLFTSVSVFLNVLILKLKTLLN